MASRIKNLYSIVLVVVFFAIFSCSKSNKSEDISKDFDEDYIFNTFLYAALDSITESYGLKKRILVHYDIYPDNVKHTTIKNVLTKNKKDSRKKTQLFSKLLTRLSHVIDDSVYLNVEERKSENYAFYFQEESIRQLVDFDSEAFFGSVNLSKVVFDKKENLACFYIAIQCGKNCGNGYIVLLDNKDKKGWKIGYIIKIWE